MLLDVAGAGAGGLCLDDVDATCFLDDVDAGVDVGILPLILEWCHWTHHVLESFWTPANHRSLFHPGYPRHLGFMSSQFAVSFDRPMIVIGHVRSPRR